jgi:uncharacterized protein YcfJ
MKIGKKELSSVASRLVVTALVFGCIAVTTVCFAQEPIVYPGKGQSADQMEKDKYECYQWSRQQTGFDPMQPATAQTPAPQQKGGALKGAAGGALMGAAVGAIAGDAGTGAAIGAASGGLIGGARRHQGTKEQEQLAQQQQASYEQQRSQYNRAWGACMEGRGFTVR